MSHSSPIATQVPHAAGIAYAMRYRGEDGVVGCWFGEGATSEGDWHEGLNFAAIHQLPVVFVCENNEYAISVRQDKQMAVRDVATGPRGTGCPASSWTAATSSRATPRCGRRTTARAPGTARP